MAKTKRRPAPIIVVEPTPEQFAGGQFERAGLAYRRVAVIDIMLTTGTITRRQYNGLKRYRDVAIAEDRSPLRDSLDKAQDGRSNGHGTGLAPCAVLASIELGCLERAIGSLRAIARAVAVDDLSVSQWAMREFGSRMRSRVIGRKVSTWFEPPSKAMGIAMLEIRMAGDRLAAEIGA